VANEREQLMRPTAEEQPKVNILLVDDRPDGLLALEAVLDSLDYNLVKAHSGEEALLRLLDFEFAVILLDAQMPKMDGFQTAALIKNSSTRKDIPIIFVTAIHKDNFYVYQGYKNGAVDYIFKPFDPHILRSKVSVFAELFRRNMKIRRTQEELRQKEEELFQARKLEAIGRLAGGVAHDFNNILTGILGISEELRESLVKGDQRLDNVNEIIKASQRAFSLTRQLLAYARRQVLSPEVLDLNNVILDMLIMLGRLIDEDIRLDTVLDPKLGAVKADRAYLEQVLINLTLNARDAMPAGGTITIKTSNMVFSEESVLTESIRLPPGPYVLLTVSDTGCGMTKDVLEHIFEPFYTTKEVGEGTGLGLATVYGIVKQNGGDIVVDSGPESGTRIDIYLPRQEHEVAQPSNEPAVQPLSMRGAETILVVEDEQIVRRVVASILRNHGYTVLEAASGPEAVLVCDSHRSPIDLLITDVVMPEMNGRQLADVIASRRPGMMVLYMSAYTQDIISKRGVLDSGIAFLEKSQISSHLTKKVREMILSRHAQTRTPLHSTPSPVSASSN
jgi:two-component system cell cycle sensor histidine kinase/response regulator CckA